MFAQSLASFVPVATKRKICTALGKTCGAAAALPAYYARMNTSPTPESEPAEEEIQRVAYFIYVESGRVPDRDLENWLAAKEYLRHRHGRDVPADSRRRRAARPRAVRS